MSESTEGSPLLIEGPPIHCLQRCLQYPQRDYDTYRGLLCQEGLLDLRGSPKLIVEPNISTVASHT